MELPLRTIEAYLVHPLPIVQADADKMGLVAVINALVPTVMAVDPGTRHGAPGRGVRGLRDVADAALVTTEHPAAVAHDTWEAVGALA